MSDIRRPRAPLLDAFRWLVAVAVFIVAWLAVAAARPEVDDLAVFLADARPVVRSTSAVEEAWVSEVFEPRYLPSPPGPLPCTETLRTVFGSLRTEVESQLMGAQAEPRRVAVTLEELSSRNPWSWLPPLTAANLYLRAGDEAAAERVLDRYLGSAAGALMIERARAGRGGGQVPPLEEVLAAIHLLQASAYVQIERSTISEDRLWRDLKNPIGYVRLLGRRRMLPIGSSAAADSPWQGVPLPSPGCRPTEESLNSRDLYNNLIVGYLRVPGFGDEDTRDREFARDYKASPAAHPSLVVLERVKREWQPEREAWVWALSNAERILYDLPWGRGPEGIVVEPWLALNLAQLLESARAVAPDSAEEALESQIHVLIEVARRRREDVGPAQAPDFHSALTRMALLDAVRSGDIEPLPNVVLAELNETEREVALAVTAAVETRTLPKRGLAIAIGEADSGFGRGDATWRRAAREDLAATLALAGIGGEKTDRRVWARRARSVLRLGDEVPPELEAVEADLGFGWNIPSYVRSVLTHPVVAFAAALLAAFLGFFVGRYLGEELRRRRSLFTSYYRLEAEEMRG